MFTPTVRDAMAVRRPSNVDMLAWFPEDERSVCVACGVQACVSLPNAVASFCLACDAITLDGVRLDIDGRIPA